LPLRVKVTTTTSAPHRVEGSLAFLNKLGRHLEKNTYRASSPSMPFVSILCLPLVDLPFTISKLLGKYVLARTDVVGDYMVR
jgi:hypothetical protein